MRWYHLVLPVEVAGVRARDPSTQSEILLLLNSIANRGFAVAQSFVKDLTSLWSR
jgi:hypothetical protein